MQHHCKVFGVLLESNCVGCSLAAPLLSHPHDITHSRDSAGPFAASISRDNTNSRLISKPISVTIIPFATFSLFHCATFLRTNILPKLYP